ncbi:MAG TPA: HEAT repeat domain-containing protein [Gemmatimonadaceae bacterium]|nr:HEAT repeat domain-containing protein [Gemmatimonadaceae bacterium]
MALTDRAARAACGTAAAIAVVLGAPAAHAQTIADRIHGASGDVEVHFAARPGVCGDGEGSMSFRSRHSADDDGYWARCEPGPVRVRLTVANGTVQAIHTLVGTRRRAIAGLTDLGAVGDRDAATYFLSIARTAQAPVAREALEPVALADSVTVAPDLLSLAGDRARPVEVRKNALFWAGQVDESDVSKPVGRIAGDTSEDRRMREQAVFVLSQLPDGAGVPPLVDIVKSSRDPWLAAKATFWLGQIDDPRASATLRELVTDPTVSADVKGQAVFVLGQHDVPDDQAFLRQQFDALGTKTLQDKVLMGVAQHGGPDARTWLMGIVTDSARPVEVRKQALFWAGQGDAVSTADLAALYDHLHGDAMRRQVMFVLSQRDDSSATDALMHIASTDPDHELRKQAMFWLGQKNDPRVAKFLAGILEH